MALCLSCAQAGAGPVGIDHEWAYDNGGIWASRYETELEYGAIAFESAGALWLGDDNEFGHTLWQSLDSSALGSISAEVLKYAFSRSRPDQHDNPNQWFQGSCCDSFPSGQVTLQASFITPIILHYASKTAWVWALEALPAYVAVSRLKHQDHWQSDVIAGWALGSVTGYWASTRTTPVLVQILPRGLTVGFSKRF